MPFTRLDNGKYVSPSGRQFTLGQVKLYYANGGKFPGENEATEIKATKPKRTKQIAQALMRKY